MNEANSPDPATITRLLRRVESGDRDALECLFRRIYPDLKRLAQYVLSDRIKGKAQVDVTVLVHEACWRLLRRDTLAARDRRHLFQLFCRAISDEWVEQARRDLSQKRGGGRQCQPLDSIANLAARSPIEAREFLALREALTELQQEEPQVAELVALRMYCGAGHEQCAELMDCSVAAVRRDWNYAKAWLHERLSHRT